MKRYLIFILLFFSAITVLSQNTSNFRTKRIDLNSDSILIDTLSVEPNSIIIFDKNGKIIPDNILEINYSNATLYLTEKQRKEYGNISISYRVFPINFSKKYFHKDINKLIDTTNIDNNQYFYNASLNNNNDIFKSNELNKRGSISRGISFGNNQDVIVNSSLNLQLSGKINNNLNILAAITDNNIPIQPDGNTQQIQEFDKVFISIFNDKTNLTVGDFEIKKPTGHFMKMYKKVQGASFMNTIKNDKFTLINSVSGAVSKGKYSRQVFNGIEGNQGPYKLRGAENETFIIVLAGTEKVFIDGKLLKRGQGNDYTIDYNTAEITFTPLQPVTKDKRIVVEFEYSDKSYARFLIANSNEFISEKGKFWLNIFSEQDSKNQSIHQELNDDDKSILNAVGDSIHQAYVLNVDSVEFNNDYVLYKMIDTTVSSQLYDSIFVYSTSPDSAFYQLGFSYVGENNGNYKQVQNSANGRVYQWTAPVSGIPTGSYEPVILLVTPKKKQMISAGGIYKLTKNLSADFEFSFTNNDINTFSSKNRDDDIGYAFKTGLTQIIPVKDTSVYIIASVGYQLIDKYFDPVERFRNTEFERDWNLTNSKLNNNEHFFNSLLNFKHQKFGNAKYNFEFMNRNENLNALRNNFNSKFSAKGFSLDIQGSLLSTNDEFNNTQFLRHKAILSKSIAFFKIGINEEQENNQWQMNNKDSLLGNSFSYNQFGFFIQNQDSAKNKVFARYNQRRDFLPYEGNLHYSTLGENFNFGSHFTKNPKNVLKLTFDYRKLSVIDSLVSINAPENTVTGRIEHSLKLFKNAISTTTYYEIGSGMEIKREFSYLEVATGQGVYTWKDYNGNGVKELNEFEIANFSDEASYIRIYTPTDDYIKTYNNLFNQMIFIRPEAIWRKETGFKKILSKFSDQFAYRANRKSLQDDILRSANPFLFSIQDSVLISTGSSIRNTFYFNRTNSKFSLNYIHNNNNNKLLLVNGIDTRTLSSNGMQVRWNITRMITLIDNVSIGNKTFDSEFFETRNFHILFKQNQSSLRFQPTISMRFSLTYKYYEKQNTAGNEQTFGNDFGVEIRYSVLKKGNLSVKINYINIKYNEETNTSIAYEMLEGFMPGNNGTWSVLYQRNLSKTLQMNLNYNGRISEDSKIIHLAGVQLRAYF